MTLSLHKRNIILINIFILLHNTTNMKKTIWLAALGLFGLISCQKDDMSSMSVGSPSTLTVKIGTVVKRIKLYNELIANVI